MHIKIQNLSFHLRLFLAHLVEKKGSKIKREKKSMYFLAIFLLKRENLEDLTHELLRIGANLNNEGQRTIQEFVRASIPLPCLPAYWPCLLPPYSPTNVQKSKQKMAKKLL